MKKILALLLSCVMMLGALMSLAACSSGEKAPAGMRLIKGSDALGYYFYGPEEWEVANQGDIAVSYASNVDTSSITFVEAEKPLIPIIDYFNNEKARFPFEIRVSVNGEKTTFGNVDTAYKFVYSYDYKNFSHSCMQIFVLNGDDFYIFTFTSMNTERKPDETYYQFYLPKVQQVIENFKFVDKVGEVEEEKPEYQEDEDGYLLVSDRVLCGFDFYVPKEYHVDYSSGIVSVTRDDGTNLNLSKATYTGVTLADYWKSRKENLDKIVDKVVDENGNKVSSLKEIKLEEKIEIEGTKWAFGYEYSYTLGGVQYHCYQVFVVEGRDGFVYTYTASEDNYSAHFDEAMKVLKKVGF